MLLAASEIDPNIIVGGLSLIVAFIFSFIAARHTSSVDIEKRINQAKKDAAEDARISTLLQSIKTDTEEMRYEMKDVKGTIKELSERLAKVEESAKILHKRVDKVETDIELQKGE